MSDLRDLDTRIVHRHIQKGRVSAEAYDAHLQALPDLEPESEFIDYETRLHEEAEQEAGPPPPVFVDAGPMSTTTAVPPPASATPATPPADPAPEPAPTAPDPVRSDAPFGTGPTWGGGSGTGGSSF